ncbi:MULTISPECIES: GNAT family N-acetyltransferase [unclassified Amycolatopsis]|uniref:GNAT family N-acetyltransferase n=1 Tax=unclassified Amycolatopsis TaxID=2618356 RepID=UPI0028759961|nr:MULTISPECIES: GNAT family N-acetyltransferase [unclassified Amycolatopsis]MDS0137293.1 GNAT family N-acetyltransferase [Amycolatopsis sp. 505]MDS0141488.1 GNAT family N-acetyltransferase [Amycolatopsis sp. CM201R]
MDNIVIRSGDSGDADTLLRFFDEAVEWLAARGSSKQWGTEPWSRVPKRVDRVQGMAADPGLRIAMVDGEPAGALIVSEDHDPHVPAVDERELYIRLLITSRRFAGRRVGGRLVEYALDEARRRGIDLVRVDCWAGGDGDLQRYYEGQGFKPTVRFDVDEWVGQVLEQRVG